MSMISSQRDTLLVMADALEEEYPSFASEVRRAADTIWELRNKLAGTVDQSEEIERLKEQVRWLKKGDVLHVITDQELADQQRHEREMQASIDALNADNNMLREMLSESRQANEKIFTELKRYKSVMRTRPIAMNALFDENTKLRKLVWDMLRWMPCPTHCYHCERYHYPEGCEFEIRWRELRIEVD